MKKFSRDRPVGIRHFAFRWGKSPSDDNRKTQANLCRLVNKFFG
jgi:hypothetical protein